MVRNTQVETEFGSLRFDTLFHMRQNGLSLPKIWAVDDAGDFSLQTIEDFHKVKSSPVLCAIQFDNNIFAIDVETEVFTLRSGWKPLKDCAAKERLLVCDVPMTMGKTSYKEFNLLKKDVEMTTYSFSLENENLSLVIQNGLVARKRKYMQDGILSRTKIQKTRSVRK